MQNLKRIYKLPTKEYGIRNFEKFKEKWERIYPKQLGSWEKDLKVLLTFMEYPESIRNVIYTTNWIERTNKEFKKRFKTMNSLPNENAVEKIVYLIVQEYNNRWSERKLKGFSMAYNKLQEMFEKRYGKQQVVFS